MDPLLADAHSAIGVAYARNGEWSRAEQSFRRAIEIAPSLSSAHGMLARFVLWPLGRMAEALREMQIAEQNDPLSPQAHHDLADVLLSVGRYDESEKQCAQIPTGVDYRNRCLGRALLFEGKIADAIRVLTDLPTNNWGYLAFAYGRAGRRGDAEKLMTEILYLPLSPAASETDMRLMARSLRSICSKMCRQPEDLRSRQ